MHNSELYEALETVIRRDIELHPQKFLKYSGNQHWVPMMKLVCEVTQAGIGTITWWEKVPTDAKEAEFNSPYTVVLHGTNGSLSL